MRECEDKREKGWEGRGEERVIIFKTDYYSREIVIRVSVWGCFGKWKASITTLKKCWHGGLSRARVFFFPHSSSCDLHIVRGTFLILATDHCWEEEKKQKSFLQDIPRISVEVRTRTSHLQQPISHSQGEKTQKKTTNKQQNLRCSKMGKWVAKFGYEMEKTQYSGYTATNCVICLELLKP